MTQIKAYLDNSATTKPSRPVVEKMVSCLEQDYFNPSAVYAPAVGVMREMRAVRDEIRSALHARNAEVTFTSGGTEANNLAILGCAQAIREPKGFACTAVEHPSVRAAYQALRDAGMRVYEIGVEKDGTISEGSLRSAVESGLSMLSVMQVNNETGAISPIRKIREIVGPDVILHVDGVQGFMRVPFDMRCADLYTLSGHKIHAPKGIGALVAAGRVKIRPRQLGGGQEKELRSGTENTPGILCLGEAVREAAQDSGAPGRMYALKAMLAEGLLKGIPDSVVNGPSVEDGAPHILNMSFPGVGGEVFLHALEQKGVIVSTGAACSSRKKEHGAVLTAMGISREFSESALRFSLSRFTDEEEIKYAIECACALYAHLARYRRN